MNKRIGRFTIVRELGRGAQSVVYLALDPHLQRQVAIKTMHFSHAEASQNRRLLEEARIVSQLRHPNIVPIFEAGEEQGDFYLVFEHVPGESLADYLKKNGALAVDRSIAIMQAVLDAVAHAHAQGIIHRDLKPSNILIDDVPRVMDFGIAARAEALASDGGALSGTPAYMAPEYITRRISSEKSDVFSAGLVFYELLTGQRAVAGTDIKSVMNKIADDDIRLPAAAGSAFDDRLTHLLYRALARDPDKRFASATQMRQAFDVYLRPAVAVESVDKTQSTIEFLLRRMRHKSDFPALSESVCAINRIAATETQSISDIANVILKDFSVTNKILRVVNSAHYRQAGGGDISTVSRAVAVLGLDAVRGIAITVILFDHLQNRELANRLKDQFLRANLAGILARDLASKVVARGDVEQVFICAMLHNLGSLLSQYYFPEETAEIRRVASQKNLTDDKAALQVLGVSFQDLGVAIAQAWGFPRLIVNSMHKLPPGSVRRPGNAEERLHVLAELSNDVCALVGELAIEQQPVELRRIAARFENAVPLDEPALHKALDKALAQLAAFSRIIHLKLQPTPLGRQIGRAIDGLEMVASGDGGLQGTLVLGDPGTGSGVSDVISDGGGGGNGAAKGEAILLAGIQDVSNALISDFKLNDVLHIILETMYRAMKFKTVVLCIRDGRSNTMLGRFGFGVNALEIARRFKFSLLFVPDIFHAALANGVDILISNTNDPNIAARIPAWFRQAVSSETFVLFPLCLKSGPLALIYADRERAGETVFSEKELSLLRTLRNQALLAVKQSI